MEGMKEQKAYGQGTSHEQIAKKDEQGFTEKISETAHTIGQKAADMGQKVTGAFTGSSGHEVGNYDSGKVFGSTDLDGGFMPGRNLPEGKDVHMIGGIGESVKRELHDSAVEKQHHAPEAISGLEQQRDKIHGQTGFGFGDQLQGQTDLGGFMPGRNLPEGQDLHRVPVIGESVKRELHDSAVDKAQHAPVAISGLERDLEDVRLRHQTELEQQPHGQKSEGGIIDTIKTKASDTAEGIVHAGHSAYNSTANALHVAKDKVVEVGTKAKEMVVGAPERSSERKGSVPDASLQFPSAQPSEGMPLDKGMLDKGAFGGDQAFDKGKLDQDKALDKELDKQKNEPHRTTQDGVWI